MSDGAHALRAWIRAQGLTRQAAADRLGMTLSVIGPILDGFADATEERRAVFAERCDIALDLWPPRTRVRLNARGRIVRLGRHRTDLSDDEVSVFAGERCRAIVFAPGYFISESGRLLRATAMRGLRERQQWRDPKRGRRTAILHLNGGQVGIHTARLVALHFIGSPPDDERGWVCHRDDNPANDHFTNLYWGSAKDNSEDCLRNEHRARGLTNKRAERALRMASQGDTIAKIARHFGVTQLTIQNLLEGRTWRHVDGERRVNRRVTNTSQIVALAREGLQVAEIAARVGVTNQRVREMISRARRRGELERPTSNTLAPLTVNQIRGLVRRGHTKASIARHFSVKPSVVHFLVAGETYKAVPHKVVPLPKIDSRRPRTPHRHHRCGVCGADGHNRATCRAASSAAE